MIEAYLFLAADMQKEKELTKIGNHLKEADRT